MSSHLFYLSLLRLCLFAPRIPHSGNSSRAYSFYDSNTGYNQSLCGEKTPKLHPFILSSADTCCSYLSPGHGCSRAGLDLVAGGLKAQELGAEPCPLYCWCHHHGGVMCGVEDANGKGWQDAGAVVDLGCLAKAPVGFELEGNPCLKSLPATEACVSKVLAF